MDARARQAEAWLPFVIALVWWIGMYPGLFGEDSLMNLSEATRGPITVWFTAWWIELIRATSVGGRYIPLVTLCSVLTLVSATREWIRACFPPTQARAWTLCLLCATPLIGGLGIQVRHDIPMSAGLLLWVAVATRTRWFSAPLTAADYLQLTAAVLLASTRHNGLPTLVGAGVLGVLVAGIDRRRYLAAAAVVSLAMFGWTEVTTRASGLQHSVEPVQGIEWAMADISCLLTKRDPTVSKRDWDVLERIAARGDWPSEAACRFLNPLFAKPTFDRPAATREYAQVLRVWLAVAAANPVAMTQVHLQRTRLFLPPFVGGWPANDSLPFIHSTILPNELGLRWAFPRAAEVLRTVIRVWNGLKLVFASAGLWIVALAVQVWLRRHDERVSLLPTLLTAVSLDVVLLATAPISEGRYGLFILICGQAATLRHLLERFHVVRSAALSGPRPRG